MRLVPYLGLLMSLTLPSLAMGIEIPAENKEQGKAPDAASFESKAALLLQAIEKNDAELAAPVFFPKDAFVELKGIAKPEEYYQQLLGWFKDDIAREHERLVVQDPLKLVSVKGGSCTWKKKGSEANNIPYWSCSKTKMTIQVGAKTETLEVKTRINWGKEWYVTHLGPIPKK